jgi:hypothetical protein
VKFAIGYQRLEEEGGFLRIVEDYRESLAEVYFPWVGMPSGRPALGAGSEAEAQAELERDVRACRASGLRLDLLLNANCYGGEAVGKALGEMIAALLEHLDSRGLLPDVVTTTSPYVADCVKRLAPAIDRRASVNLRLDSTLALEMLGDAFDSFYLRRDLQRDLSTVARFHAWADAHGKRLCLLANSGCLRNCPYQTFHDNLLAHDAEIARTPSAGDFLPHLCWKNYLVAKRYEDFLRGSWIRPEDVSRYEPYVSVMKLATRVHSHPRMIVAAYAAGRFDGNLAALTEPDLSAAFAPRIIDNRRFPSDWLDTTAGACATNCTHCGRCTELLATVLVDPSAV